jgi:adenine-specific DNA-methyltransferase
MRYLGSKTSLLENIYNLASEYTDNGIFCDPFGGIGTVGRFMKKHGYQVISGDVLYFAHCFQTALIENNAPLEFTKLKTELLLSSVNEIEQYLNCVSEKDGWLINEYSIKRQYFTLENAKRIQGCINSIQYWKKHNLLQESEYKILMASLIQSFDKVANTAGTYYAYLKKYYRKAENAFVFEFIQPTIGVEKCKSFHLEASQLVDSCNCDILYLDPPYNERDYGRYYHLPENISKGIEPIPKGKSGIYVEDLITSSYNKKSNATKSFEELIKKSKASCIIFHYTDDGLIRIEDAVGILGEMGTVEEFYFDCKGYQTVSKAEKCKHHILRVIR